MGNKELTVADMQNAAALTAQNLTFEKARILEQVGAIKMAAITRRFVSVTEIEMLAGIKQSKQYKDLPMVVNGKSVFVTTWEQFCNAIGSSVETVDNNIRNYQRMGGEFFEYAQNAGIPQRALGQIGRLPETDRQTVLEMAQKEGATKEAVLEVLEQVMARQAAEKELAAADKAELEAALKAATDDLASSRKVAENKNKLIDRQAEQIEALRKRKLEAEPADVAESLKMELSARVIGVESSVVSLQPLLEELEKHGQKHGMVHIAFMTGVLNQILMQVERLKSRFDLPVEVPEDDTPEWLKNIGSEPIDAGTSKFKQVEE